jgi:putative ABC transport system ATP-binding protein
MNMIRVTGATVSYGVGDAKIWALRDANAVFPARQLTLVTGPSGSGKTSLLSVAGCLIRPDTGTVLIDDLSMSDLTEDERASVRRKNIGFVFQGFRLFDSLSARDNVAIMGQIAEVGNSRQKDIERADELLLYLGLFSKAKLRPCELSGGERQRVGIARALFHRPKVILADEPTASLDSSSGRQVMEAMAQFVGEQCVTVVVVSHDSRWLNYAHSIIELEDGRVMKCSTQT